MNDKMKMLTKNGESYSPAIMAKKIIYKALQGVARVKYVDKGGRNKTDKEEILDIMEEIEDLLEVEREVEAEARQSFRNNRENDRERTGNEDNKQPDNSGKAGEETVPGNGWTDPSKNMCKKPGHKHPWNACPENRFSKNYKGDDAKGRGKSGENNSINQKDESQTVVRFEDPDDFDFSDDESVSYQKPEHMMIASPKQEEKHPVTIISLPTAKGEVIVTTCLVDQCFTGMLLMSEKTAKELDLELVETQNGTEYTTAAGTLKTTHKVTVDNIKLPCLSKTRRFKGTFEIIPTGASSKSCYGVFLGSAMMRELVIDTSIINNTISWGEDITTQMVPRNYWTPERMQTEISKSKKSPKTKLNTEDATIAVPKAQTQVQLVSEEENVKPNLAQVLEVKLQGQAQSQSQVNESMGKNQDAHLVEALTITKDTIQVDTVPAKQEKKSRATTSSRQSYLSITIWLLALVIGILIGSQIPAAQVCSASTSNPIPAIIESRKSRNERIIRNDSVPSKQNMIQMATPDSRASTEIGSEGSIETRMQESIFTAMNKNSPVSDSAKEGSEDPCTIGGTENILSFASASARQTSPTFQPGGGDDISHQISVDILSSVLDAHTMNTIIGDERHVPKHSMEEASSTNKCKYIRGFCGPEWHSIPLLRQYEDETYLPGSAHFMNYIKCIELQRNNSSIKIQKSWGRMSYAALQPLFYIFKLLYLNYPCKFASRKL